jgi:hypothetical protein
VLPDDAGRAAGRADFKTNIECKESTVKRARLSGIYALHGPDGSYVGQAVDLVRRKGQHQKSLADGTHPNNALRLHKHDLTYEVLEHCRRSRLNARELHWIAKIGSYNERPSQKSAKAALKRRPARGAQHWLYAALYCATGWQILGWWGLISSIALSALLLRLGTR